MCRPPSLSRTAAASPTSQLGQTLTSWRQEIVAMWRFIRNGITEGFHNKMELINRQAYGFRNFGKLQIARQGTMWVISLVSGNAPVVGVKPHFWA
jgi:hypothetical protein